MSHRKLLLTLVALTAQATALADGGTVQWRAEAGRFVITAFTSPSPLSAGPVDFSLLLQDRNGLAPVLDAEVSMVLRAAPSGVEIEARASREQAQNKLLYAAPLLLTEPGKWRIDVTVLRNQEKTIATGTVNVAPASESMASYWGYLLFPPFLIAAFAVRERLIRRKTEEGK